MRGPRHRALRPAYKSSSTIPTFIRAWSKLYRKADDRYNSGLFHFHKEKDRTEAPDELTPNLADRRQAAQGHHPPPVLSRQPLRVLGPVRRNPRPGLRAVSRQGDPPDGRPSRQGRGQAGSQESRRRLLHAHLHRRIHRRAYRRQTAAWQAGKDARDRRLARPDSASSTPPAAPALSSSEPTNICSTGTCDRYTEPAPAKANKQVFQTPAGAWRLTTAEKKRILLEQHLRRGHRPAGRGSDQALADAQGAGRRNEQSLAQQLSLFHERALPDLSQQHQVRQLADRPRFLRRPTNRSCSTRRNATASTSSTGRRSFRRS